MILNSTRYVLATVVCHPACVGFCPETPNYGLVRWRKLALPSYLGSRTAKRSAWSMKTRRKSPVVRTPSNPFTKELFPVVVLRKDTPDNSSEPIFTT